MVNFICILSQFLKIVLIKHTKEIFRVKMENSPLPRPFSQEADTVNSLINNNTCRFFHSYKICEQIFRIFSPYINGIMCLSCSLHLCTSQYTHMSDSLFFNHYEIIKGKAKSQFIRTLGSVQFLLFQKMWCIFLYQYL